MEVFRQCLRNYGHGCLSAFLPQVTSGSGGTPVSTTSSSVAASYQSLIGGVGTSMNLLQNLMREESSVKLTSDQQYFTCCLLATADWCAETTMQLQEKLKQRLQVNFFFDIIEITLEN